MELTFLFLHLGRAISYGSYFYNPNTWFSGIIIFFLSLVNGEILITVEPSRNLSGARRPNAGSNQWLLA